jgi:hypothetical protein
VGKPLARLAFRPRVRGREHLAAGSSARTTCRDSTVSRSRSRSIRARSAAWRRSSSSSDRCSGGSCDRSARTGAARAAIQAGVRDLISIDPPIPNHRVLLSRGFLGSTAEVPEPVRREAAEAHLRVRRRIDELLAQAEHGRSERPRRVPPSRPHFRNRLEASETAAGRDSIAPSA